MKRSILVLTLATYVLLGSGSAAELLRFEFKTKPIAGQIKPRDHNHE